MILGYRSDVHVRALVISLVGIIPIIVVAVCRAADAGWNAFFSSRPS